MTFEEWWEQNWLTIICLMPVGPGNAKETARAIWQPATAAAMERCAKIADSYRHTCSCHTEEQIAASIREATDDR